MIIDARELSLDEAFKGLREVVSVGYASSEEVSVFVDAGDCEKLIFLEGFLEILLDCKTRVIKGNGSYILKAFQEPVASAS
jgi:hypothetical protein